MTDTPDTLEPQSALSTEILEEQDAMLEAMRERA